MKHRNEIPIGETILRVSSSVRNNTSALLRLGFPAIVIGLSSTIYYAIYDPEAIPFGDFTLTGLVFTVLHIAAYAMAIIGIHRVFILPPDIVANTSTFRWTTRESGWLLWSIAIGFSFFLILIIPSCMAVSSFDAILSDPEKSEAKVGGLIWLFALIIGYFAARWSLIFPSIATDGNIKSLSDSWEHSKGNVLRLFFLIGIIPAVTSWAISFLPDDRSLLAIP